MNLILITALVAFFVALLLLLALDVLTFSLRVRFHVGSRCQELKISHREFNAPEEER